MSSVTVTVLFFAKGRELAGVDEHAVTVDAGSKASDVVERIVGIYPALETIVDSSLLALNLEYCSAETVVSNGDQLALIPPISGG